MAYGDKRLFERLNLRVAAGDRLGITGPNGTGKTTLLRLIVGEIEPLEGRVSFEQSVTLGYYKQDAERLDPSRSVLDEILSVREGIGEQEARNYLAGFLFRGEDVFKPVGMLSGGEQSRLRLAGLILSGPDILILDEPTNHLDIPSREALEAAIEDFPGAVIAVSHDRYFLDRTATCLLMMRPDGCTIYAGNYSYYLEQVEPRREGGDDRGVRTKTNLRKQRKAARAQKPKTKTSPYDRMTIEELEALVIEQETELALLQERFGDPDLCRDPDALAELKEQVEEAERKLAEVDAAWQERAGEA